MTRCRFGERLELLRPPALTCPPPIGQWLYHSSEADFVTRTSVEMAGFCRSCAHRPRATPRAACGPELARISCPHHALCACAFQPVRGG